MSKSKSRVGLGLCNSVIKRAFDLVLAGFGLLAFSWVIILVWLIATIDTNASGFFRQERVGRNGRIFKVIKIRTMRSVGGITTNVTCDGDPRITSIGRVIRMFKLDELPQLWSVFRGDMSFVGPRPDVPGYADRLEGQDRIILTIRPGITGPATLKYKNEEVLLSSCDDPERYNREIIFPDKVRLNREYVENYNFLKDMRYIWDTILDKAVSYD